MSCASATSIPFSPCRPSKVALARSGSTISWRIVLSAGTTAISRIIRRRRQRLALKELDDHLLRDIGISRADACREARKLFWQ